MSNKIFKSLKDSQKSYKICLYCNTENQLHIFLVSTPVFERRLLKVEGLGSGLLCYHLFVKNVFLTNKYQSVTVRGHVLPFNGQSCISTQIFECNCPR